MIDTLLAQDGAVIYLLLALFLLGGALGLPIPEDIPLIAGGVLVQMGKSNIIPVLAICYVSVVIGDIILFWVGRVFGSKIFKTKWFQSPRMKARLRRVRMSIDRRSVLMIFVARHLFYLRTATFLSCGALKMKFMRFLTADAIAALISVPLMVGLGYLFAGSFDTLLALLKEAKIVTLVMVLVAPTIYLVIKKIKSLSQRAVYEVVEDSSKDSSHEENQPGV